VGAPSTLPNLRSCLDVDGTILDVVRATPQRWWCRHRWFERLANCTREPMARLRSSAAGLFENLDDLFVPLRLPCVGGYGVQLRTSALPHPECAELSPFLKAGDGGRGRRPRIIVEDKGSRSPCITGLAPDRGPLIKNKIAAILDRRPAEKLEMLCGKSSDRNQAAEFSNKGVGVCELMKCPRSRIAPRYFVGDDVTDESVFAVLPALGGFGYSVGREWRASRGPSAVRRMCADWLTGLFSRDGMKSDERFGLRSCDYRQWAHGSAGGPIVGGIVWCATRAPHPQGLIPMRESHGNSTTRPCPGARSLRSDRPGSNSTTNSRGPSDE